MNNLIILTKTLISLTQKPFTWLAGIIKSEYIKHKYDEKFTEVKPRQVVSTVYD